MEPSQTLQRRWTDFVAEVIQASLISTLRAGRCSGPSMRSPKKLAF